MDEQKQDQQSASNQSEPKKEDPKNENMKSDPKDVEDNKIWAFIGYLGILCLIPLLAKKDSKFAQFHAKQGLVLLIGEFFVWIPLFGWLLGIFIFILWIMAIINVFSGEMKKLPIIGEIAEKINI